MQGIIVPNISTQSLKISAMLSFSVEYLTPQNIFLSVPLQYNIYHCAIGQPGTSGSVGCRLINESNE